MGGVVIKVEGWIEKCVVWKGGVEIKVVRLWKEI